MTQGKLDINNALSTRASISIDPEESAEDRAARLKIAERQAVHDLVKAYVVFILVIAVLIGACGLCVYEAMFDPTSTAEAKRVAWAILSSIVAGSLSFVLGQKTAKK